MTTTSSLILPGQRGIKWHRYIECQSDDMLVSRTAELVQQAEAHGHEYSVLQAFFDIKREVERARVRASKVEDDAASSYVALGYTERLLFVPIRSFGLFEGEIFDLFEVGAAAGVRVIFVGTRTGFETLPYALMNSTDDSNHICGCERGF